MAFDALVGVGDDELDAAPATAGELAQERGPECLGLRRANIRAETLALAITVDADCDDHRDRHDATILAHPHVGGVDPQIRPVAFDRTGEEGLHFVIDLGAEPADRWAAKPITSRNRSASGVFSHERAGSSCRGTSWFLGCVGVSQPDPTGELPVTTAKPPFRYGAK